jgi:hypothetical protein
MGAVASAASSEQALFCYRCQQTKYVPFPALKKCNILACTRRGCRAPLVPRPPTCAPPAPATSFRYVPVAQLFCPCLHFIYGAHQLVEDSNNVRLSRPRPSPAERSARERLLSGGGGSSSARIRIADADDDDAAPGALLLFQPRHAAFMGALS